MKIDRTSDWRICVFWGAAVEVGCFWVGFWVRSGGSSWYSLRQNEAEIGEEDKSSRQRCGRNWVMKIAAKVKAMPEIAQEYQCNCDSHFDEANEMNHV